MDCVLILFRRKLDPVTMDPDKNCVRPSWSESLRLMSAGGFLQNLMTFPKVTTFLAFGRDRKKNLNSVIRSQSGISTY